MNDEVDEGPAPDPAAVEPESDLDLEAGRLLFARPARFVAGAAKLDSMPSFAHETPEIAFAGRSNCGKSSLINALVGQKMLARTSQTPGRTQQINFFDLAGALMLVDLPGYGYAKAPKDKVRRWTELTYDYLRGRPNLRRVCVLVDARRGVRDNDRAVMTALDQAAVPYQVLLTKADKMRSQAALTETVQAVRDLGPKHVALHPVVRVTSAQTGRGIEEVRGELAALAAHIEQ
ncbi:GTP-binding protein [Limimonas halophila]|uniref:Probable GTP-binding protein EngB n=1 Tax=Limimonas halophila TaxID=1082479 RepID=A0A1G7TN41_9PROT|nr:ribosome biogenesis GTP-binding protein YihA/YsxC [Limimonas halophila]SDG36695.1 GTP-binding protein [Limimonas halophila]